MAIQNDYRSVIQTQGRQLPIFFKSLVVGIASAIVVILYRLLLSKAEELRTIALTAVRQDFRLVVPLFLALIALGLAAGFLIKRYP